MRVAIGYFAGGAAAVVMGAMGAPVPAVAAGVVLGAVAAYLVSALLDRSRL